MYESQIPNLISLFFFFLRTLVVSGRKFVFSIYFMSKLQGIQGINDKYNRFLHYDFILRKKQ